jgi:hypothetical protein
MQNMSKNMAKMSTSEHANKAPDGPTRSPAWPRGLPRHFDFPAGRVGGFGVHSCTGGATGAGLGLLYFDWRNSCTCAHAGIAFAKPDFGYNKRQKVKSR